MHLLNWNLSLRLSRFRAIKSNGMGTTIKFTSFSMVGRRSGWVGRGTEAFVFVTSGAVANGLGFADGGGGSGGGGSWGVFINGEKNLGGCVNERTHLGVC